MYHPKVNGLLVLLGIIKFLWYRSAFVGFIISGRKIKRAQNEA